MCWPNAAGYALTSDGRVAGEEATRRAHEIFNAVRDEARSYYRREYRTNPSRQKDRTRMSTFYESRTRRAVRAIREEGQAEVADDVETILSGFRNSMAALAGDDLENCRLR